MSTVRLCILGATGSVGAATLSVVRRLPEQVFIDSLTAHKNVAAMRDLCAEFRPRLAVMRCQQSATQLREALSVVGVQTEVQGGDNALQEAVQGDCCTVVAAIAGCGGLLPTLAAARAGRRILLANKESLVAAGAILMQQSAANGGMILPIDSEHAALFELLDGGRAVERLWLTASGGAVRDVPLAKLDSITPAQALSHPTWKMGDKITIDSATMMNKVLEIIEASVLFSQQRIGAVLHPQSVVHALVQYGDGTMIAHLSPPDMRRPIARMLFWPAVEKAPAAAAATWDDLSALVFAEPDRARYPCLELAEQALAIGGAAPAVLSAANETAVERFLAGNIRFTDIARINRQALTTCADFSAETIDDIQVADSQARAYAQAL